LSADEVRSGESLRHRFGRGRADLFALAWIFCFALLFVSPALKDGPSFAPADVGSTLSSLTAGTVQLSSDCVFLTPPPPNAHCAHNNIDGDQITQAVPWANENWELVHHGELPFWNDLSGTGMPQLLNFESGSFALPSLVSYLAPLSVSFLVIVLMKLLICGFGAYVLARMLHCRPLAAAFAGVTAMLSGSFAGWLGWSITSTFCWVGFVAAGLVWCYREPRRTAPVGLLAVSVAFSIYGGFPEGMVIESIFFVLLIGATVLALRIARRRLELVGIVRMAIGAIGGLALSAPLWLTGLSSLRASIRADQTAGAGILPHGAALLFAQGYFGLPIAGSTYFGTTGLPSSIPDYFETAAYVGIFAIALVVVALLVALRRPIVAGFSVAALGCLLLAYRIGTPGVIQRAMSHLGLGSLVTSRSLPLLGFAVAILAAVGLEQVIARSGERSIRRALVVASAICALALGYLALRSSGGGLSAVEVSLRRESLYWPVALMIAFVIASVVLLDRRIPLPGPLRHVKRRPGVALAVLALAGQSAFLLFAGVGINSYASVEFPGTPGIAELAHDVGSSLVAIDDCVPQTGAPVCDVRGWNGTGLYPEMNLGYGIDELGVHDPLAPAALFDSWPIANAGQRAPGVNLFAPSVNTVALARRYGASFILLCRPASHFCAGVSPPPGTKVVATIGDDVLVSVPDSGRFVSNGATIAAVDHPSDASYEIRLTPSGQASTLVAHITAAPGWKASVDGRAAPLRVSGGVSYAVTVPAHATEVTFSYSPPHFVPALVIALVALLAIVADALWHRRRAARATGEENGGAAEVASYRT
jgi:hypothetical protein